MAATLLPQVLGLSHLLELPLLCPGVVAVDQVRDDRRHDH